LPEQVNKESGHARLDIPRSLHIEYSGSVYHIIFRGEEALSIDRKCTDDGLTKSGKRGE
jgi:hypothetical protein